MWNKIIIEGKDYIVKISNESHNFSLMLSDFIQIWYEQSRTEEIIERCKKENPMFEADDETFINHMMTLVKCENPEVVRSISESEDMLLLKLQTSLEGIKFKYSCRLHKGTPQFFYENIIHPLLMVVQELQTREDTLCSLLTKKDIEINEYKMNGAQITRRSVETQRFSKLAFKDERLNSLQKVIEDSAFNPHDIFTSCTADLYQKRTIISNSRDIDIKEEVISAGLKSNSRKNKKKRYQSKRHFKTEEELSVTEASVPLETIKNEPDSSEDEEKVKIKKRKRPFKGLKL